MVEVAVIGAGAAGLVASRHLLRCGLRPCVFEASRHVGGAWNPGNPAAYKMWDHLTPNLSKYTCVFSDFSWPEETAAFPTRLELQQYLENYANEFVEDDCLQFGCTVTSIKPTSPTQPASPQEDNDKFLSKFQVEWSDEAGASQSREFDGVVVATGFFATPQIPEAFAALTSSNQLIHSSQYRSPSSFTNQTVAVCGSSFSALEIAADVRKCASKVISVVPTIPYVLPRYVPSDDHGQFAPLDCVLYRRKEDAPKIPASVAPTSTESEARHAFLRKLQGPSKQAQSPLGLPQDTSQPPMVAISDDYLNLVQDGNIDVVKGRVENSILEDNKKVKLELNTDISVSEVDQVIACTGYKSQLDTFLDASMLKTLEYTPDDSYAPLTLCHDTYHPNLPGIGFVGLYRGPYFGVMELQARLLAGMMSGQVTPSNDNVAAALEESRIIRHPDTTQSQFPRYDYVGFMDSIASQLNLVPKDAFGAKGTMVTPAFYQPSEEIANKCKQALDQELHLTKVKDGGEGTLGSANMAKIALSAMIGNWDFHRTITQFNAPSASPQIVTGSINFSHIPPRDGDNQDWNAVLYDEKGIFNVAGKDLEVFRRYEYETKPDGILEIYFVEGGQRAHLFLSLKFVQLASNGEWTATSDHLCIKDLYKGTFTIAFGNGGLSATRVTMTYRVKGPNKDYQSVTVLMPSQSSYSSY